MGSIGYEKVRASPHHSFPHSATNQACQILNSVFTTEHHVAFGMSFNFSEPQFSFLEKYLVGLL